MEIKGIVHCFFEQSGTFKNEFIKLGIPAKDYDIQNNFGETDHVMDLFAEIEKAYEGGASVFDSITCDDLIIAFYPCVYFCFMSQTAFGFSYTNYKKLSDAEKIDKIIDREKRRDEYFTRLLKFIGVCLRRNIRMIFENPLTMSFLSTFFIKEPDIRDNNRRLRGDYYKKPTGYWFFNCKPENGFTEQDDKEHKRIKYAKPSGKAGICSEERSMISPDYARNFICDFLIGKSQPEINPTLFD